MRPHPPPAHAVNRSSCWFLAICPERVAVVAAAPGALANSCPLDCRKFRPPTSMQSACRKAEWSTWDEGWLGFGHERSSALGSNPHSLRCEREFRGAIVSSQTAAAIGRRMPEVERSQKSNVAKRRSNATASHLVLRIPRSSFPSKR